MRRMTRWILAAAMLAAVAGCQATEKARPAAQQGCQPAATKCPSEKGTCARLAAGTGCCHKAEEKK